MEPTIARARPQHPRTNLPAHQGRPVCGERTVPVCAGVWVRRWRGGMSFNESDYLAERAKVTEVLRSIVESPASLDSTLQVI